MKSYQGIGAAVNAHLARFQEADREIENARAVVARKDRPSLQRFVDHTWGMEWALFGASYGIVGPDGNPMIQTLKVNDEQTIVGRSQASAEGMAAFQGAYLGTREHSMLSKAVSHYVSAEIVMEVTEAAEELGNEPIHHTDLFTPYGFAVLETPLVVPDLDADTGLVSEDQTIHIRAFGWSVEQMGSMDPTDLEMRPGVTIWMYSTPEDLLATGLEPYGRPEGHMCPMEVAPWTFGKSWEA